MGETELWAAITALQATVGDLTVAQTQLRGDGNTMQAELRGELATIGNRVVSLEETRGQATKLILEAIRETQPPRGTSQTQSQETPSSSRTSPTPRDAGMVTLGGGLGAAIWKAAEMLFQ